MRTRISREDAIFLGLLLMMGVFGVFFMRYLTPSGHGLVNDSVGYINGARNILAGDGYSRTKGDWTTDPITHFPPMFSIVLAFFGLTGLDPFRGARFVNLLLFGANIIMVGVLSFKLTSSRFFSVLAALLFLFSEPFLRIHSFALSEPLFLFLSFVVFWLLSKHLERPGWFWIAGVGLISSMAFLTRYVGASLYVTACLCVLAFRQKWAARLKDWLVFLVSSVPPVAAWIIRGVIVSGDVANRRMIWHPVDQEKIGEGLTNFWGWLLPEREALFESLYIVLLAAFLLLLIALAAAAVLVVIRRWRYGHFEGEMEGEEWHIEPALFSVHALAYISVLVFAMSFFDASTRFEHRMLVPFNVCILFLVVGLLAYLWRRPARAVKVGVVIVCVLLAFSIAEDSVDVARVLRSGGQGFAGGAWRNSEVMKAVRYLPEDRRIFSNRITATYLLADRPSFVIPYQTIVVTGEIAKGYWGSIEIDRNLVMSGEAFIVIFNYENLVKTGNQRIIDLTEGLPVYEEYSDGVIFGLKP